MPSFGLQSYAQLGTLSVSLHASLWPWFLTAFSDSVLRQFWHGGVRRCFGSNNFVLLSVHVKNRFSEVMEFCLDLLCVYLIVTQVRTRWLIRSLHTLSRPVSHPPCFCIPDLSDQLFHRPAHIVRPFRLILPLLNDNVDQGRCYSWNCLCEWTSTLRRL